MRYEFACRVRAAHWCLVGLANAISYGALQSAPTDTWYNNATYVITNPTNDSNDTTSKSFWPLNIPKRSTAEKNTWNRVTSWGPNNHPWSNATSELSEISVDIFFIAIIPGLALTLLFWVDQNISAMVALDDEFNMTHGHSFHLDFLLLGKPHLLFP